ncbi:MAG: Vitamin B12 import ATP-binding protein BtuD [Mycoplasmataceae bacterium]|nr:MAG: Vitamin B12 import ATP-binding protein BtuD [Mycoplasmataceae bacterium]
MSLKPIKKMKLNWFTITKRYWKEQLFFFILTTLSALINYTMDINVAVMINNFGNGKSHVFTFWNKKLLTFQNTYNFFWFMTAFVIIYFLAVIAHVYYSSYFTNKISRFLKKKISQKLFFLNTYNEEKILANLDNDEKNFTSMSVHYPSQIYYFLLTGFLTFTGLWISKKEGIITNDILLYGAFGLIIVVFLCLILNYFVYKKDLFLQKEVEKIKKEENILVNNRNLIIKKSLAENYQNKYGKMVNKNYDLKDKKDWNFTLALVIPGFLIIPFIEYILLPLISFKSGRFDYTSLIILGKFYGHEKKMIDRLKDYSYYFSAKKRLNLLLNQSERDDYQKNIIISESIENVNLKGVNFSYEDEKKILNNYNFDFQKGKVNHLIGENGSGKSTTINLVVGLNQPSEGEILINNKYKMNEINLIKWREKIAYAEHKNLIENRLSTGQKQLIDLNKIFSQTEDKEVFIFDEVDNFLDESNKKEFRERIDKLSKRKLVILISH